MNTYDPRYMQLQQEKLDNIINKKQTVVAVSIEMAVSRQTIHKWLLRYKRFGIDGIVQKRGRKKNKLAHNRTPEALEQCVISLAQKYGVDGVQTLSDRLQYEYNTTLHPTTIYRILKRKNIRYTEYYTTTRKRWKKQLFAHRIAGKEMQMDTKYPHGYKQGKVIYTIIDDASRWAFVWSYSTANAVNTEDFVKKVLRRAPFTIQKIRTDQGTEFLNYKLKNLLEKENIIHRKNTPYCPEENGKIERFHGTLNQKALRYDFSPSESLDSMQYKLNLFMHYYNYQKRHRGLGMDGLTPMQKLNELKSVNLSLQCHIS
jgi:transposase InsO family protein